METFRGTLLERHRNSRFKLNTQIKVRTRLPDNIFKDEGRSWSSGLYI